MPANQPDEDEPKPPARSLSAPAAGAILVLTAALMIPAALYLPPVGAFLSLVGLMILFMIVLGLRICGRFAGILINERNLISLSRFQLILWTVLILSAFMTAAFERLRHLPGADALAIALDPHLWALLGISTASLVGTPLLEGPKKVKEPKPEAVDKAARALNENPQEVSNNAQGVLYANPTVKDAAFTDMFEGDEVVNTAYVDVAKVQMFFFTVVAVFVYGASLVAWLHGWKALVNPAVFPAISQGLLAILGISHAAFLGSKSTTQTPQQ